MRLRHGLLADLLACTLIACNGDGSDPATSEDDIGPPAPDGSVGDAAAGDPVAIGARSCTRMDGDECNGESCCTTIALPAGTFHMGRSVDGSDSYPEGNPSEQPEHAVTVSAFSLDRYEVTVARYRQFIAGYDEWRAGGHPIDSEGQHPNIAGTGWKAEWSAYLPDSADKLAVVGSCFNPDSQTWTAEPGANELLPMNCVSWFEAFAFCLWDGGRLPTEAEWEYAAAGGDENRLYPWGATAPGANAELAIYGCHYNDAGRCTGIENLAPVGSAPAGNARWGHADLAGSIWEWTYDWFDPAWYSKPEATGTDVVSFGGTSRHVQRGGFWRLGPTSYLRAANRLFSYFAANPLARTHPVGLRCARSGASPALRDPG